LTKTLVKKSSPPRPALFSTVVVVIACPAKDVVPANHDHERLHHPNAQGEELSYYQRCEPWVSWSTLGASPRGRWWPTHTSIYSKSHSLACRALQAHSHWVNWCLRSQIWCAYSSTYCAQAKWSHTTVTVQSLIWI